jgi:hypothetical protein
VIINATAGAGLPAELLHMIEELGTELERDHRKNAKQESENALRQGLKEADAMRSAASKGTAGAFVSGSMTALGGAAQLYAGASMKTAPDPGKSMESMEAHNAAQAQYGEFGKTLTQLGGIMNQGFAEAAKMDDANSREAAARAEAAARLAESEQSAADAAQRTMDKARDTYAQIMELEHASVMASLRA